MTRTRIWTTCLGLFFIGTAALADELSKEERDAGFVSMFNGKDFTGWRFEGKESPPKELPLSGGGKPHLGSAKSYRDFEMKFEWRAVKENYNSGFFIRSGEKVGANQINLAKAHEGAFIGGKITGAKEVPQLQKKPGEWNEWRVLVVGDKVTFWCNEQLAWEATGLQTKEGYIGLQAEGAPLEFRKLRIRELKPAE
ncbi:MAG: hypothetical protein FD138_526 [Planctomycetota bacterium]|nr:MAG: hypothetical protein FD138_526 [Planctomycetota bacterium]